MPETTIYKHWMGALYLGLIGGSLMGVLFVLAARTPTTDPLRLILIVLAMLVSLYTIVALWTYSLSKITLSSSGIQITTYSTLFASTSAEADWNTVQSITASKPGLFSQLLGYGTLVVQTADAQPNLRMTFTPTVEAWKQYIDEFATLGGSA